MKRVNIKDAFVGEPTWGQEEAGGDDGDEALVLAVRGGEVVAVVPAGTAEDEAVGAASIVRGALRLENERVLTFEIHEGASSAFFEDESAQLHRRRLEAGPSGLSNITGSSHSDYMRGPRTAGEIMTRDVLTASPSLPVEDLTKLLAFHNISGMPVVDDAGKVIGIVSEADVISKQGATVGDIMTAEVVSVSPADPVEQLAALMAERTIKRVPVMAEGELLGMVSRADIVRALAGRQ